VNRSSSARWQSTIKAWVSAYWDPDCDHYLECRRHTSVFSVQ